MGFLDSKIENLGDRIQVLRIENTVNFGLVTKDNYLIIGEQERPGGPNKTCLGLFGGYISGEETPEITLMREMFEETNIKEEEVLNTIWLHFNLKVSEGYTTESNSTGIVYLKNSLNYYLEFLKCNDTHENIQFKIYTLSNEKNDHYPPILSLDQCETMRLFYLIKELRRSYKID
jgi:8-oxo-dGTP pyrophosphatase MutT (NUDIX family)